MATSSAYTSPTYAAIKTEFNALPRGLVYNQSFSFRIATHDEMVQMAIHLGGGVPPPTSLVVNEQRGQLLWTEFLNFCSSGRELHRYYCHHSQSSQIQATQNLDEVNNKRKTLLTMREKNSNDTCV